MFPLSSIPRLYFSIAFEWKPTINWNSERTTHVTFTLHRYHPRSYFPGSNCCAAGRIDRRKGRRAFDTLTVTLSQLFPARAFAALPSLVPSVKSRRACLACPPCPECIMVHVQSTNGAHARSFDRDTACRKIEISADYRQIRMTIELLQLSEKHSNHDPEEEKTIFSQMSGLSRMIFRYVIRYLRDYLKQKGKLPRAKTNTREIFKANIKNSCILSECYTVRGQRDERKEEVYITDTLSNHCQHG